MADAPFPSGTSEDEWRPTRSRRADDVNAEVREAVDQNVYSLFRIGLSLSEFRNHRNPACPCALFSRSKDFEEETMGKGILLWLLGVPIPVIILLWLFFGR
jgi:hypothetical protein